MTPLLVENEDHWWGLIAALWASRTKHIVTHDREYQYLEIQTGDRLRTLFKRWKP